MKTISEFKAHLTAQIAATQATAKKLKKFEDAERVATFEKAIINGDSVVSFFDDMNAIRFDENNKLQQSLTDSLKNVDELIYAPVGTRIRVNAGKALISPSGFHPDDRIFRIVNK